jgi:hypothetical protein
MPRDAGGVHQHVHRPDRSSIRATAARSVTSSTAPPPTALGRASRPRSPATLDPARGHDHMRPGLRQRHRRAEADPARAPGHQRTAPVQTKRRCSRQFHVGLPPLCPPFILAENSGGGQGPGAEPPKKGGRVGPPEIYSAASPIGRALAVGHVHPTIAPHPDVALLGMPHEPLQHAQPRAILPHERRRLIGQNPLIGMGFQELANPKPTGIPARPLRRQRVVRPDHLVAIGHVRPRPEEQRAVIRHVLEEPLVPVGHHLHMLIGHLLGDRSISS